MTLSVTSVKEPALAVMVLLFRIQPLRPSGLGDPTTAYGEASEKPPLAYLKSPVGSQVGTHPRLCRWGAMRKR